ncbi:MAG: bifunctional 4-hydroxy-3-methylbut-2-enyl diphosphate reductase/30S ribosomal protein S1 [Eubacteriales bacterium]|nr:bifunctional 4-hydroxy-3-methylbut-2-enyl diphosphate reductase/30S ribosomal protein S1 [Eubacteriales bacterium]
MKRILTAETAGFCFGVERAVNRVYRKLENRRGNGEIYTYGPIIHNEIVVGDFEKAGVRVLSEQQELPQQAETIVIRSHGVSRKVQEELAEHTDELIDATCPFVRKIHRLVTSEGEKGREIFIVGNEAHPEVQGIIGWCITPVTVIGSVEEARALSDNLHKKISLVAQTTFNIEKFKDIVEIISEKGYDVVVLDTICDATFKRQTEAVKIAEQSDLMFVIGGKTSSNTQKLFEICSKKCEKTFYVQSAADISPELFKDVETVGITAGASTPKKIIEEVQRMAEQNLFEQMLEESIKTIHNGEVVEGKVIDVKPDEIILNIGYKADGILTRNEYSNDNSLDLTTVANVDDTMEVKVLKVNDGEGQVLLTYKRLQADKGNKRLEEAFEAQEVLKAPVVQVLNGGLSVVVEEARVFIPASLVSDTYEKNLEKYAGQEIEFIITEFNPKRRRIIGNRKQLLVAQKAELRKELFERIQEGDVVEGTVKNITDFGAFIDLGGADGLLHISEMAWGRVDNPKSLLKVDEKIRVLIKEINGEKIALSLKFPEENPWEIAAARYSAGSVVRGRVARMTDFGAFVELEAGVDALLHVSQISRDHVEKPSDVLKVGQEIEAQIVDFNGEEKKISLSMKALQPVAEADEVAYSTEDVNE